MKKRVEMIDYIKAFGIVLVIILHVNEAFELGLETSVVHIFHIKLAVPIFMMLSGYTAAMS